MTEVASRHGGTALLDKEGKYLTFALAQEQYGLEILKVREIIGYMEITAVPQTPSYVRSASTASINTRCSARSSRSAGTRSTGTTTRPQRRTGRRHTMP